MKIDKAVKVLEKHLESLQEYQQWCFDKDFEPTLESLVFALGVLKRVDVDKIRRLLGKWGVSKELGFQYKLAHAIYKEMTDDEED